MKYILFSAFLIVAGYGLMTAIALLCKKNVFDNKVVLSRDVCSVCKGFAICIIMLTHIGNTFGVRYLTPLGSWGVGIFLILSGYGLELSVQKNGLVDFWKKRIVTAWLPYVAAEAIGFILCATPDYANPGIINVFLDLLLIQPIHPFGWYMQCLFLYYIGFYFAHKLFSKNCFGKYSLLLAVPLLFLLFFRSLYKQQVFTFIMGVLLATNPLLRDYIMKKKLPAVSLLLSGILLLAVRQLHFVRDHLGLYELLFSLQVLSLSIGTISILEQLCIVLPSVMAKGPIFLGTISFEIYLYHAWIYNWVSKQTISYGIITIFFVVSIVIAAFAYLLRKSLIMLMKKLRSQTY